MKILLCKLLGHRIRSVSSMPQCMRCKRIIRKITLRELKRYVLDEHIGLSATPKQKCRHVFMLKHSVVLRVVNDVPINTFISRYGKCEKCGYLPIC